MPLSQELRRSQMSLEGPIRVWLSCFSAKAAIRFIATSRSGSERCERRQSRYLGWRSSVPSDRSSYSSDSGLVDQSNRETAQAQEASVAAEALEGSRPSRFHCPPLHFCRFFF